MNFLKVLICLWLHVATPTFPPSFRARRLLPQFLINSHILYWIFSCVVGGNTTCGCLRKYYLFAHSYHRTCSKSSSFGSSLVALILALEILTGPPPFLGDGSILEPQPDKNKSLHNHAQCSVPQENATFGILAPFKVWELCTGLCRSLV